MKIRIQSPRQRLLDSGIVLWVNPKPPVDKLDLILEKLEAQEKAQNLQAKSYLTKSELAEVLNLSTRTIDRLVSKCVLPSPITISDGGKTKKILRWKRDETLRQYEQYQG